MKKLGSLSWAPWLTRLILLPPTIIFALIAFRYIANPAAAGATVGISLDSPLAHTIARVGFGAFPLAFAILTLACLLSTRRLLTGLSLVGTILGVALLVRIFGIFVDGTARESIGLVRAEAILLALTAVGLLLELARRRHHAALPAK